MAWFMDNTHDNRKALLGRTWFLPTSPTRTQIIGTSAGRIDTFTLDNIQWPAVTGLTGQVAILNLEFPLP